MWSILCMLMLGTSKVAGQFLPPIFVQQLTALDKEQEKWAEDMLHILPSLRNIIESVGSSHLISEKCGQHLKFYNDGLAIREPWALKMLDASTKLPESIMSGASLHLGNFDQCLSVKAPQFSTQHCGPSIVFSQGTFSLSLQVATCLPASCSAPDIEEAVKNVLMPLFPNVKVALRASDCYTGTDKLPLDAAGCVMIAVFCLLGLAAVIGTTYDFLSENEKGKNETTAEVLKCFSLTRNLRSLVSTRHLPGTITCLHGLRVLSLYWIILGHRFAFNLSLPLTNPLDFLASLGEPAYSLLVNSYIGVDTFFFLSGFLVCYVFLNDQNKGRNFNLFSFYIYRYIRLTTCLALLIGYYVTLLRYTGYGPRWNAMVDWQMEHCDKYWWLNLLYLNNYVRLDYDSWDPLHPVADCVDQGWYLTVDMQLAWLAPLVLIPLVKWPRVTSRVVLPLLVLISCFTPFTSTYINKFPMTSDLRATPAQSRKFVTKMYWPTHMRATPYLMGIALSFFMHSIRNLKITIVWWTVAACWTACTVLSLVIVFATVIMYNEPYNQVGAAFFAGFHRLAWSLALAWIVFACSRGYGGPVNAVLSWRGFLPLSRLSYCMFITHFVVLYYDVGQARTYAYYNNFGCIMDFFSDLFMTCLVLGLPLYLCCEAPTLNLLRVFFRKGTAQKPVQSNTKNKTNEPETNKST